MGLWLAKLKDWDWDEIHTVVVRAPDETEARRLASRAGWSGRYRPTDKDFLDPGRSTCKPIPTEGRAQVIATAMDRG